MKYFYFFQIPPSQLAASPKIAVRKNHANEWILERHAKRMVQYWIIGGPAESAKCGMLEALTLLWQCFVKVYTYQLRTNCHALC